MCSRSIFTESLKWLSILVADFLTMFFRELQYLPTCALDGCQLALDPTVRGTGHLHPLAARLQRGCRCFHLLSNLFRLELAMDRSKVISLSLLFSGLLQWKDPKYSLIQVRRELGPFRKTSFGLLEVRWIPCWLGSYFSSSFLMTFIPPILGSPRFCRFTGFYSDTS